jgi:signal transduction histidine kinase/ActR/RegA family two-component response regulator
VRSYLAVPVRSRSGEVLGGLFFGHPQPGRFEPRHEQLAAGLASSAAVALDNARLYKEAQDANRAKDEFLATLSHELRTPLNAMLGWAHMLRSMTLPPGTVTRALESIERNARAQAQLVEDLLDVSRIVSGKLQIDFSEVDLAGVVLEAVESVRPALLAKRLDLQLDVPREDAVVKGDADRLRQIVWNLLSNATKFTPAGGQLTVLVRTANGRAEVVVRDTGVGIPRQFLRHVFERFRQAESTVSRRHGGLGLGLAIVRHLVEAHGGTVQAESAGEGHGATFTVRLPAVIPGRDACRPEPATRNDARTLSGVRALVVDDEADACELTRVALEMHGAIVTTVGSAGEALHALTEAPFDVLISDIGMPEQDGYSLIQAIRALKPDRGGGVAAIAATAYASSRERSRALGAGYDWHLPKPLDPEQLVATVLAARKNAPER